MDLIVESPFVLSLICAVIAALVVAPVYMSPYVSGRAIPASRPTRFPVRSFVRAALVVFVVLLNAATLGLAHRFPLGSDLIAAGFLLLLFSPAETHVDA